VQEVVRKLVPQLVAEALAVVVVFIPALSL
jgi:hypothetical protein